MQTFHVTPGLNVQMNGPLFRRKVIKFGLKTRPAATFCFKSCKGNKNNGQDAILCVCILISAEQQYQY